MTDFDDQDALAAEYVLGTLDSDERSEAAARAEADAEFAARVQYWEHRLGSLSVMVDEVEPGPALWEKIRAGIGEGTQTGEIRLPGVSPEAAVLAPVHAGGAEIVDLSRRVRRWRGASAGLAAMAALLAIFVAVGELAPGRLPSRLQPGGPAPVQTAQTQQPSVQSPQPTPVATNAGRFVAVLQKDANSPAFLLTVDTDSRMLTVRRVAAEQEPGKSYELWLVSDQLPAPKSLGVVGQDEFTQHRMAAADDADMMKAATYAVSLEPQGGSPSGAPTGPVMYLGKLMEAMPPAAPKP
jgi:anti-sigma-K factor RskA